MTPWLILGVEHWLVGVIALGRYLRRIRLLNEAGGRCGLCDGPAIAEYGALFSGHAQRRICRLCMHTTEPMETP